MEVGNLLDAWRVDPVPGQQVDDAVDSLAAVVLPVLHGLPGVLVELRVVVSSWLQGNWLRANLSCLTAVPLLPSLRSCEKRGANSISQVPGPTTPMLAAGIRRFVCHFVSVALVAVSK
jgi:hypothetical protein